MKVAACANNGLQICVLDVCNKKAGREPHLHLAGHRQAGSPANGNVFESFEPVVAENASQIANDFEMFKSATFSYRRSRSGVQHVTFSAMSDPGDQAIHSDIDPFDRITNTASQFKFGLSEFEPDMILVPCNLDFKMRGGLKQEFQQIIHGNTSNREICLASVPLNSSIMELHGLHGHHAYQNRQNCQVYDEKTKNYC
jgi:hypothetical protein